MRVWPETLDYTLNLICARVLRNAECVFNKLSVFWGVVKGVATATAATFVWTTFCFPNAVWMKYLPLRVDGRDVFLLERAMVGNDTECKATSSLQCLRYVVNI